MSDTRRKGLGTMKRYLFALAFMLVAVFTVANTASAQEILLEGPLAGAPAVRQLVKYREMRLSVGPQFGYTLLNDYMHNFMVGGRIEFNIFDWLSIGGVGYYVLNTPTKLTKHISDSTDISGDPTTPAESNFPSYTGAANFENQVSRLKGMYLGQVNLIPFRGKLSMFSKAFLAVDGYISLGGGVIQYEERKSCELEKGDCGTLQEFLDNNGSQYVKREKRTTGTFTLGVGFMFYFNDWLAMNLEWRLAPFKWNPAGTDESGESGKQWVLAEDEDGGLHWETTSGKKSGSYPDNKINEKDRQWTSNQSVAIGLIFYLPTTPRVTE